MRRTCRYPWAQGFNFSHHVDKQRRQGAVDEQHDQDNSERQQYETPQRSPRCTEPFAGLPASQPTHIAHILLWQQLASVTAAFVIQSTAHLKSESVGSISVYLGDLGDWGHCTVSEVFGAIEETRNSLEMEEEEIFASPREEAIDSSNSCSVVSFYLFLWQPGNFSNKWKVHSDFFEPIISAIGNELSKWDQESPEGSGSFKIEEIIGLKFFSLYLKHLEFLFNTAFDLGLQKDVPFMAVEILDRVLIKYRNTLSLSLALFVDVVVDFDRTILQATTGVSSVAQKIVTEINSEILLFCTACLQISTKIHDATSIITPKLLKSLLRKVA